MLNRRWCGAVLLCGVCQIFASTFAEERLAGPTQTNPAAAPQKRTSQERAQDLAVLVKAAGGFTLKRENGEALRPLLLT